MPDKVANALDGIRKLILGAGLVIIILLGLLAAVVYFDRNSESDRRAHDKVTQLEGRIEICHSYNVDQTRSREFNVSNILTLSQLSGRDVETVKQSPKFAQYKQFVNDSFPYRQCSESCVMALYDSKIPDCKQAKNEHGDP